MLTGDTGDLVISRDSFDLAGIQNLFEKVGKVNLYNPDDPPDLPREYAELGNRRPRFSQRDTKESSVPRQDQQQPSGNR